MTTRVGPALCVENIISFYLHAGSIGRIISLIYKMLLQSKGFKNGYNFTVALQFLRKCEWIIGGGGGGGGGRGGQRVCWPPLQNYWGGLDPSPSPLLSPLLLRICKKQHIYATFSGEQKTHIELIDRKTSTDRKGPTALK